VAPYYYNQFGIHFSVGVGIEMPKREATYQAKREGVPARKWLKEFYKAILELGGNELSLDEFRICMKDIVAPSSQWTEARELRELLRNPEFFLARTEAARTRVSEVDNG
jgi:hypothetical protein